MSSNISMNSTLSVEELFLMLESNKLGDMEKIKKVFHDHFLQIKESWLVNGLFDYYMSTNSLQVVEVLSGVREPHDKFLFDKLLETFNKTTGNDQKVKALTLLGYVAKRQPTWLYKLTSHGLFKTLTHLLKVDEDLLSLTSALLLIVTLLPMLPTALTPHLHEIFDGFFRIASFHYQQSQLISLSSNTNVIFGDKNQFFLIHLQIGLHNLFHRLYAMYPINFISFLNAKFSQRDQFAVFKKVVSPMLDSVKMHPLLVTMTKDQEISPSRWKKMEHHDVVVECGRFAIDRYREEVFGNNNSRFTPISDYSFSFQTPINQNERLPISSINGEQESLWSPSMVVSPHSPPPATIESRSTPSTPGNKKNRTSPPEPAVEATPETTPVKDLRQTPRQPQATSTAVRALGGIGNGILSGSSRPSTPSPLNLSLMSSSGSDSSFVANRINKVMMDRQTVLQQKNLKGVNLQEDIKNSETESMQNGRSNWWQEDQEVSDIVNSTKDNTEEAQRSFKKLDRINNSVADSSGSMKCGSPNATLSCPNIKMEKQVENSLKNAYGINAVDEATQTSEGVPYEHLLLDLLNCKTQVETLNDKSSCESPTAMLDHYIEVCAQSNSLCEKSKFSLTNQKLKKKSDDDSGNGAIESESNEIDKVNQLLHIMQIQMRFERFQREVHAERNRRLLGKLRESREIEEINSVLSNRLKLTANEVHALKKELDRRVNETRNIENKFVETVQHWQLKCKEEQQLNLTLKDKIDLLELDLKNEKKKVVECEKQTRAAEATLFEAAHRLKEAIKAANKSEELKRVLDSVQKRFLLFGEAKMNEKLGGPANQTKKEASILQRSYSEDISNLRSQSVSQMALIDNLKARILDWEHKDARKEIQLVEQQRLLLEAKEKHEAELDAVESKYKAQVNINLFLESRILELLGKFENTAITAASSSSVVNLASSISPKERSPPLSGSLASSSEGSLAFVHTGQGIIMNDPCDFGAEIPNLQAIVEPGNATSAKNLLNNLDEKFSNMNIKSDHKPT